MEKKMQILYDGGEVNMRWKEILMTIPLETLQHMDEELHQVIDKKIKDGEKERDKNKEQHYPYEKDIL